jgi:hypothetical protein
VALGDAPDHLGVLVHEVRRDVHVVVVDDRVHTVPDRGGPLVDRSRDVFELSGLGDRQSLEVDEEQVLGFGRS